MEPFFEFCRRSLGETHAQLAGYRLICRVHFPPARPLDLHTGGREPISSRVDRSDWSNDPHGFCSMCLPAFVCNVRIRASRKRDHLTIVIKSRRFRDIVAALLTMTLRLPSELPPMDEAEDRGSSSIVDGVLTETARRRYPREEAVVIYPRAPRKSQLTSNLRGSSAQRTTTKCWGT